MHHDRFRITFRDSEMAQDRFKWLGGVARRDGGVDDGPVVVYEALGAVISAE
jgi:hypothetical protein